LLLLLLLLQMVLVLLVDVYDASTDAVVARTLMVTVAAVAGGADWAGVDLH